MNTKTVVITGSTRGIGYGLAREFLKRNHQVIINGRNAEQVKKSIDKLQKQGFCVTGVAGDVTLETTFQKLIEYAVQTYGKIDIWINNAGIPQSHKFFNELENDEIQNVVSVNIIGLMKGTKAAINYFKKQGYGKLLNMEGFGSDGRIMDKLTLYGTSKRAVNYFTKSISREVKEKEIQVGVLMPGMVRTDFLNNSIKTAGKEELTRNKKVFDILAEDTSVVTEFLVPKILKSTGKYPRINFLTKRRLIPKIVKLMFVK